MNSSQSRVFLSLVITEKRFQCNYSHFHCQMHEPLEGEGAQTCAMVIITQRRIKK